MIFLQLDKSEICALSLMIFFIETSRASTLPFSFSWRDLFQVQSFFTILLITLESTSNPLVFLNPAIVSSSSTIFACLFDVLLVGSEDSSRFSCLYFLRQQSPRTGSGEVELKERLGLGLIWLCSPDLLNFFNDLSILGEGDFSQVLVDLFIQLYLLIDQKQRELWAWQLAIIYGTLLMVHIILHILIDILSVIFYEIMKKSKEAAPQSAKSRVHRKMNEQELQEESKSDVIFKERLKPISQVTEEQNTFYNNNHHLHVHPTDVKKQEKDQQRKPQSPSLWKRSLHCLKSLLGCLSQDKFDILVKEEDLMKTIIELRAKNLNFEPKLPPLKQKNRKTLVFDLEGSLIHLSADRFLDENFSFEYEFKWRKMEIHGITRFGLDSFLYQLSKDFEIVVYTSAKKELASAILEQIDKKKRVSHVLTLDSCITLNKFYHIKSMSVLGRDPSNVIFIDHNRLSGILHRDNFLQIPKFTGDKKDRELIKLLPFLREMANCNNILPIYQRYSEFNDQQIDINIPKSQTEDEESSNNFMQSFERIRKNHERVMQEKKKRSLHKRSESFKMFLPTCSEEDQSETSTEEFRAAKVMQSNF